MPKNCGKVGNFSATDLLKMAERKLEEFREALIEEVRQHEFLYNKSHKDHPNKGLVQQTWLHIASNLNYSAQECQSQWKSIREAFSRERRFRNTSVSGQGSSRRKPFKFYESLLFLDKFVKPRQSRSTIGDFQASDDEANETQTETLEVDLVQEGRDTVSFAVLDEELRGLLHQSPVKKRAIESSPTQLPRKSPRRTITFSTPPRTTESPAKSTGRGRTPPPQKQAVSPAPSSSNKTGPSSTKSSKPNCSQTAAISSPSKEKEGHILSPHLPVLSPSKEYKETAKAKKDSKAKTDQLINEALNKSLSTLNEIAGKAAQQSQESDSLESALGRTIGQKLMQLPTNKLRREWRTKFTSLLGDLEDVLDEVQQ